jgi:hypothetical protein
MKILDIPTLRHGGESDAGSGFVNRLHRQPSKGALAPETVASVNDLLINARRLTVCRASRPSDLRGVLKICALALTTKRTALIKMRHLGKNARC